MIRATRTITLQEDSTLGVELDANGVPYFAEFTKAGVSWPMLSAGKFLEIDLYDRTSHAVTTLGASNFDYLVEESVDGDSIQVSCEGKAPYASISVVASAFRLEDGRWAFDVDVDAHATGKALARVRYPYFKIAKRHQACLAWPQASGFVVTEPHLAGKSGVLGSPGSMQYFSMFDTGSRQHFYVATDDEDYNEKIWQFTGDGLGTTIFLSHTPDGSHHADNLGYAQPFGLTLESFRGKVGGKRGHWDAALKYRPWGTHVDRPWMTRRGWQNPQTPAAIQTAGALAIHHGQAYDVLMAPETTKLKTWMGAPGLLEWYYGWFNHDLQLDNDFPDLIQSSALTNVTNNGSGLIRIASAAHGLSTGNHVTVNGVVGVTNANSFPGTDWTVTVINADTYDLQGSTFAGSYIGGGGWTQVPTVRSAMLTAWATMKAAGVHPIAYWNPVSWNETLTRKYNIFGFSGVDVSALVLKGSDGTINADAFGNAPIDYAQAGAINVALSAMAEMVAEMGGPASTNLPEGLYLDAVTNFLQENYDVARSSWKFKDWNAGLRAMAAAIKSTYALVVPTSVTITEWCDESLLGVTDLMFLTGYTFGGSYALSSDFAIVYGEHVRMSTFENLLGSNSLAEVPGLLLSCMIIWHAGGIPSYNCNAQVANLIPGAEPVINDPLFFWFDWLKKLQAADDRVSIYRKGRLMRPCVVDGHDEDLLGTTGIPFTTREHSNEFTVLTSTWMNIWTGELGIIITHHVPVVAPPIPGAEYSSPETVKLRINADDYPGLGSGEKTIYRNDAGTRVLLGKFVSAIELSVVVTPSTVTLIEVVPADIHFVTDI